MLYNVEVKTPNLFFFIKGKATRSPFTVVNITEHELQQIKTRVKSLGVNIEFSSVVVGKE